MNVNSNNNLNLEEVGTRAIAEPSLVERSIAMEIVYRVAMTLITFIGITLGVCAYKYFFNNRQITLEGSDSKKETPAPAPA